MLSFCIEQSAHFSEAQQAALSKLTALLDVEYIKILASQGPDVLNAHLAAFMQVEANTIENVHNTLSSALPLCSVAVSDKDSRPGRSC